MGKIWFVFALVTVSVLLCGTPYAFAGQDAVPPLLQRPAVQPAAPTVPPELLEPGTPTEQPVVPPPSPRQPGNLLGPAVAPPPPPGPAKPENPPKPAIVPPLPGPARIGQPLPVPALLNNLSAAVATVQKIGDRLSPGKVWTRQGPAGEVEIKAGIVYRGSVVAVVHFDPQSGRVLSLGMHPRVYQVTRPIREIEDRLPAMIRELKILPAAEFREPEASWVFPIALGNTIVAHLKVYCDGIHIFPDYPANQEMATYGQ